MATEQDGEYKFLGAARRQSEAKLSQTPPDSTASEKPAEAGPDDEEDGEVKEDTVLADEGQYRWFKCFYEPAQTALTGYEHCFLHQDTRVTTYEEPNEPYWVWDSEKGTVHECGLQHPASWNKQQETPTAGSDAAPPNPDDLDYNPKIHGSWDENAPYAKRRKAREAAEAATKNPTAAMYAGTQPVHPYTGQPIATGGTDPDATYSAQGAFNRITGGFQSEDRTADRYSDAAKSGRQLGYYFDVDAAANQNDGRSLKAERRNQHHTKKEIQQMNAKRRERKEKKRMDFYKS